MRAQDMRVGCRVRLSAHGEKRDFRIKSKRGRIDKISSDRAFIYVKRDRVKQKEWWNPIHWTKDS